MCRYSGTSRGTTDEITSASMSAKLDPAQAEQAADVDRQLVARRLAVGREAPVLDQLGAVEGADVSLGVADVDREQHRGRL